MVYRPPYDLEREIYQSLWDAMRARAAEIVEQGGPDANTSAVTARWAKKTTKMLFPKPKKMPLKPARPSLTPGVMKGVAVLLVLATVCCPVFFAPFGGEPGVWLGFRWRLAGFPRRGCRSLAHGRYLRATRGYWLKHDPHVQLRRDTRTWLEACSERLIHDALDEFRRPAATIPVADMTVARPAPAWGGGARPAPMMSCDARQAEFLAKAWMEYLGAHGCRVSQATRDGGIDVASDHFVVEVKHHAEPVSPGIVRQIVGVASIERKRPLVFSLSGYPSSALDVGKRAGAALFRYNFQKGTLEGETPAARLALKDGLNALLRQDHIRG